MNARDYVELLPTRWHKTTDRSFLDQTAIIFDLDRLVLPPDDLLTAWIHTTQQRPRHGRM
ncbi:hypothetical protein [Streptomyces sp. SPB4]|uniref:hypothetical protein n=1 Tax=Streptomyces sp. SPB4 TaxID=2940553 RepID=UPI002476E4CB|nr:hypothetical protein [Streptomyces sp. SPB4]MDH6543484.1 hypothetical protein [Streptomyces sp. SPB4]